MSRQSELLRKAADALDDGQIPLMNPFLADNEVTFDECMDMAELLAEGARLIAWAMENPKMVSAALGGMRMEGILTLLRTRAAEEAER